MTSRSSKKQNTTLSNNVKTLEKTQADLEKRLRTLQEEHQSDTSQFNSQLEQSNSRIKELQREVITTVVKKESRHSIAVTSQKSFALEKKRTQCVFVLLTRFGAFVESIFSLPVRGDPGRADWL